MVIPRCKIVIGISIGLYILSSFKSGPQIGDIIDRFNGVPVYYNGNNYTHVSGRHKTTDGYNLGLKWQCVEYVKRYYYEVFDHRFPNTYGHAKDYFDNTLLDSAYNAKRGLIQMRNVRIYKPQVNDILVYGPSSDNRYGHVAIITEVGDDYIEIIQQNMKMQSRQKLGLVQYLNYWTVADYNIRGWLRKG
jgi:hypothetical protein